jgi:hypothetical protein
VKGLGFWIYIHAKIAMIAAKEYTPYRPIAKQFEQQWQIREIRKAHNLFGISGRFLMRFEDWVDLVLLMKLLSALLKTLASRMKPRMNLFHLVDHAIEIKSHGHGSTLFAKVCSTHLNVGYGV